MLSSPKAFLTFGDGLGYVPITYHSIKAKKTDEFTVEVKVTLSNDGAQDTEESVLIFTSCSFSNITVDNAINFLFHFETIFVEPLETVLDNLLIFILQVINFHTQLP